MKHSATIFHLRHKSSANPPRRSTLQLPRDQRTPRHLTTIVGSSHSVPLRVPLFFSFSLSSPRKSRVGPCLQLTRSFSNPPTPFPLPVLQVRSLFPLPEYPSMELFRLFGKRLAPVLLYLGYVSELPCLKAVPKLPQVIILPQFEEFTLLSRFEHVTEALNFVCAIDFPCVKVLVELPYFKDVAKGLVSSCFLRLALFDLRRNNEAKETLAAQAQGVLLSNQLKNRLTQGLASRRYFSSVLIAECLAFKSAFNAAHSLVLRHINVSNDTHSLVVLLRSKGVTNKLKIILLDTYCHLDVFSFLSLPYVSRLEVIEVFRLEFIEVGSLTKSAICNVNSSSTFGV